MIIDNKKPIVYISGWLGNGKDSGTYRWLEKHFKNIDAFATGGNTNVKELIDRLQDLIDKVQEKYGETPILVANSYGGYLSTFMGYMTVLINPSLYASETIGKLTQLSEEEIENYQFWEKRRDMTNTYLDRSSFFPVLSDSDEIIPDHKIKKITSNKPVIVPGGKHQLTSAQRTQYLLPVIEKVLSL